MQENQNIEWKESWRDEYIKWLCGFANAQGGLLVIGKNDDGVITGIPDAKKLLEDIPNKVRDILGIIVDVDLKTEHGKDYLEIKVDSYPHSVSYKGQYHYRSGSTKQELKGAALDKFLLRKYGRTWDSVPVPYVSVKDLDNSAFELFLKKAYKSKRLEEDPAYKSNDVLLEKLNLKEGKYIKRAAVLLFHPNPEKFITGSYVKIGFFENDFTLLYQDEIHGNLFNQIENTMELLLTKYLKAYISYEGLSRVENYLFPETALREALLNALAHKDYSSSIPIQIRIYDNKIIIFNEGHLPEDWTVENLKKVHSSKPFNPDIANTLFRAGYIESWGSGTIKIINECIEYGNPAPTFKFDSSDFMLEITSNKRLNKSSITDKNEKVSEKMSEKTSEKIIRYISENADITIAELSLKIGVTGRTIERNINKLQKENRLKRSGSDRVGKWEIISG